MEKYGVIADIGGTNARFALVDAQKNISQTIKLPVKNYTNFDEALKDYLAQINVSSSPEHLLIDVAGPIHGDFFQFTNSHWSFSIEQIKKDFHLKSFEVINDFAAIGLSLPFFKKEDLKTIKEPKNLKQGPKIAIGPGTGLGVVMSIPTEEGKWILVPSEGGHATMAARNEQEDRILNYLRQKYKEDHFHVSTEKVVSGMGLENIYEALHHIHSREFFPLSAPEIADLALKNDSLAKESVLQMFHFLGTAAGSIAVETLSYGGVYIAGGIVPQLQLLFDQSHFIERFEQKGRTLPILEQCPIYLITHDLPAFLGLAAKISESLR